MVFSRARLRIIPRAMRQRSFTVRKGDGKPICGRCVLADTFFSRLRGLLGRGALDEDEGMLITPASSIHTCFMRFRIDVVFLEADLTVLGVRERLKPWRATAWRGARLVLELPAGAVGRRRLRPGGPPPAGGGGGDETRGGFLLP